MRVTIELSDEDGARFVREHRGWIRWEYDLYDGEAHADIDVVEVDGVPPPPPPECTIAHRRKSKCTKRH